MNPKVGYTEHSVLKALVNALEELAAEREVPITLWIRPHPRENAESFEKVQSRAIDIHVSNAFSARDALMANP